MAKGSPAGVYFPAQNTPQDVENMSFQGFTLLFIDYGQGTGDILMHFDPFRLILIHFDTFTCPKFQGRVFSGKKKRLRHAALVRRMVGGGGVGGLGYMGGGGG